MGLVDQLISGVLGAATNSSGVAGSSNKGMDLLLDGVLQLVKGQVAGGAGAGLSAAISGASAASATQGVGLAGLVARFAEQGLASQVQSWVSTGKNQPVSGQQIEQVFGAQVLQGLASRSGIGASAISAVVAQILPEIVDRLTPAGQIPNDTNLEQAFGEVKQRLMA